MADDYRVIGTPVVRPDGAEMISGQAVYGPDVSQPGMLWGKILRSPLPHAKIRSIDVEKARRLPGVTVITAQDVPDRRYGYAIEDNRILAADKVRCVGEPVAAAAAPDEERALEALSLIDVDYEELPAVFDAAEAARDGAPLVHEELGPSRSVYLAMWEPVPGTNIIHQATHQRGDVDAALARADHVFEDTFHASQIHHSYMEPHSALAAAQGNTVTVWTCSQEVFPLRTLLAALFAIPESRMRVICTKVGGGFGGKIDPRLEPVAVALALSSRNSYLAPVQRAAATVLYRALSSARDRFGGEKADPGDVEAFCRGIIESEPLIDRIDYVAAVDPDTIEPWTGHGPCMLAAAVRLGDVRLIDNVLFT